MGAVLSTNLAPPNIPNLPVTAPLVATAPTPNPAAPLPANDLRRSIKRKFEPLELVSTTAHSETLPRPNPLSSSKKRRLRQSRQRIELRLQAHAASAHINALSTHTAKLDQLLMAVDRANQPSSAPISAPAGAPPPAYAASFASDIPLVPRPL
jgi:hypothetical protein